MGVVVLSMSFLAHVSSLAECERLATLGGEPVSDLVEVACRSSDGSASASWACPADGAPAVGSIVRVSVEVVA